MTNFSPLYRLLLPALLLGTLAAQAQNVGIGTTSPSQRLEVAGTIFSSGGYRFPDGSTQATAASGTGFIQNTTTQQAASFNVSGSGTIGGASTVGGNQTVVGLTGLLTVGGGATLAGTISLDASGTATTNIGTGSTAGLVSLGHTCGTVTLTGNVAVATNLRRAVRLCPVNATTYTLVAADAALDNFKVATGSVFTTLTLPTSSAGQTVSQELTIYTTATTAFTNTDNTTAITVPAAGTLGTHAVKFIWDGIWIRVQ